MKAAATALGVTPGAVSQQIKALEDRLGIALFERGHREIRLTRAGRSLLAPMSDGFDQIENALDGFEARRQRRATLLRVSTMASFAATWLVPRLGRFTQEHPSIEISLSTSPELVSVGRGRNDVDIAIRHGLGDYAGLAAERLIQPCFVAVGSPDLVAAHQIRTPADCLRVPLLQDSQAMDWSLWLRGIGVNDPKGLASRGPRLSDGHLLIQAAVAGQGLALIRDVYAASEIAAGRLTRVFDTVQPADFAYWTVTRPEALTQNWALATFRKWLLDEAARDPNEA